MPPEDRSIANCVEQAAKVHDTEATRLHDELIEKFVQKQLLLVPEARRDVVMGARRTPAAKRSPEQLQLLREFPMFQDHIILGEIDREGANKVEEIRKRATADRALKPSDPMVQALVEASAEPVTTVRFHRGDPQQPREVLKPGLLSVMGLGGLDTEIPESIPGRRTSGRRLELARRLTDRRNPLTARVMVNRIWQGHFGTGLVETPSDFGRSGMKPSHPELLDWLAAEFIRSGWSVKAMHRRVVLSATYRQSAAITNSEFRIPNAKAVTARADANSQSAIRNPQLLDSDARLLWRFPSRRLEAEAIRDTLLAVSGRLDTTQFGPPVGTGDRARRSIYMGIRRNNLSPFLEIFDAPKPFTTLGRRDATNVPAQSLALLNDPFVIEAAKSWAEQLFRQTPQADAAARIQLLFETAFARPASADELAKSRAYLTALGASADASDPRMWQDFIQSLFNLKEFIYVR